MNYEKKGTLIKRIQDNQNVNEQQNNNNNEVLLSRGPKKDD